MRGRGWYLQRESGTNGRLIGEEFDLASITRFLDKLSSNRHIRLAVYGVAVVFFFGLILLPPILGILAQGGTIGTILNNPDLLSRANSAIVNSFTIAFTVSMIDVILGLPMAWFIVRGNRPKLLGLLDTMVNIPFILPTSALGYSLLVFWNGPGGLDFIFGASIISPGWLLVGMLHFSFSYPVVVRVMVGEIMEYDVTYEVAARTLGSPPFTVARTVSLPILKSGMIASFLLAFSRSLSETGATLIVAGAFSIQTGSIPPFENGPVFIQLNKSLPGQLGVSALVYVSALLIVFSLLIFTAVRVLAPRIKFPIKRVWSNSERKLSRERSRKLRDLTSTIIFILIIALPSLYVAIPSFEAVGNGTLAMAIQGQGIWSNYWSSILNSFSIAAVVTLLVILSGLPVAVLIARRKAGRLGSSILDSLVNIPIIIPSVALGVTLPFFWWAVGVTPGGDFGLVVLAHLCITYPYFVRSAIAAIENINPELENAARTLGGHPFTSFRRVTLPLMKYSVMAGSIIVFTRSLAETGATVALATQLKTAPVLVVDWVKSLLNSYFLKTTPIASSTEIGLGCGILILFSILVLLALGRFVRVRRSA
nr:ABC transporter permease subunit [Candidatus Njordarchaeota archaeon]